MLNPSSASRPLQRHLFLLLSGLCLWSIVWPLLIPHQPPLPKLPAIKQLPGQWELNTEAVSSQAIESVPTRRFHPLLGPSTALGPTRIWVRPNGDWLRLTPISSWTRAGFSIESATQGIANLTNQPYQTCLTRTGKTGIKHLADLIGETDKMLSRPQRLWHVFVPTQNRSYSCLIITTNSSDIVDKSSISRQLLESIHNSVTWPDPPALSPPGTRSRVE